MEYILLIYCYETIISQFAIPMPFIRNGINLLYFQLKSERQKSPPLYSLAEYTTMCYSNVTKLLHSLLAFTKEGILLEFYVVRHCKPGKLCYIVVTFLGLPGTRQRYGNIGRRIPWKVYLSVSDPTCSSCTVVRDAVHQSSLGQGGRSSSFFHSSFSCCFSVRVKQHSGLLESE